MIYVIIIVLISLLIISFVMALRVLSKIKIPQEIARKARRGEKTPVFWGVILFLKEKNVHYSSLSSGSLPDAPELSSECGSSSKSPSKISERMEA